MKTYEQRTEEILEKVRIGKKKRQKTRAFVALSLCLCFVLGLGVLFVPYDNSPPDVSKFASSLYYSLIQQLNQATHKPPAVKNNYEYLVALLKDNSNLLTGDFPTSDLVAEVTPGAPVEGDGNRGEYVETTDNQVQGVVEGDLIKRTDRHIFYLRGNVLSVYSLNGADSAEVGRFTWEMDYRYSQAQLYLSQDCTTATVFTYGYGDLLNQGKKEAFVCILSLDVSDPGAIKEKSRQYVTGSYVSSRQVDGRFLLINRYTIQEKELDFSKESTFVPQYGTPGNMTCVPSDNIIFPENLTNLQYTVVTVLEEKGLAVSDCAALLSYSQELYVSKDHIFITRGFTDKKSDTCTVRRTEITALSYSGEKLEKMGSVVLDGWVKNQYAMDENDGILRVVTSTMEITHERNDFDAEFWWQPSGKSNVSLYCVDLADFSVKAKVEAFAPQGETAESVRFDGKIAYVCTAEVITLTDPVYVFDLTDLDNITYKDTGTIDGYSSSLVNFGDYLLGIGFNGQQELKIEIYRQTEKAVESVCSYERPASFSRDYKAYLIDRDRQLIGLGIYDWETGHREYLLLGFDGVQIRQLASVPVMGDVDRMRSVLDDGWFYVLTPEEGLHILSLFATAK